MKLTNLMMLNAAANIAIGIAFTLYAPIMMSFFSSPEVFESPLAYWQVAAFARLLGATLMGFGLLLFSVRSTIASLGTISMRGIIFAMLLANLLALIVLITQQLAAWQTPAGWMAVLLFGFFLVGYGYFYIQNQKVLP